MSSEIAAMPSTSRACADEVELVELALHHPDPRRPLERRPRAGPAVERRLAR